MSASEQMADRAIAALEANLPAIITGLNAETGASNPAGVVLEQAKRIGWPRQLEHTDVMPLVEVSVADDGGEIPDVSRGTGFGRRDLKVRVTYREPDRERIMRVAHRWGRAVMMALLAPSVDLGGAPKEYARSYPHDLFEAGKQVPQQQASLLLVISIEARDMFFGDPC